jgi:hypothetical protein
MSPWTGLVALALVCSTAVEALAPPTPQSPVRKTAVMIEGEKFLINGQPTYQGRTRKDRSARVNSRAMENRALQLLVDGARGPESR